MKIMKINTFDYNSIKNRENNNSRALSNNIQFKRCTNKIVFDLLERDAAGMKALITLEEATRLLEIIKSKGTAMVSFVKDATGGAIYAKPLSETTLNPRWEEITSKTDKAEILDFKRYLNMR